MEFISDVVDGQKKDIIGDNSLNKTGTDKIGLRSNISVSQGKEIIVDKVKNRYYHRPNSEQKTSKNKIIKTFISR